MSRLCLNMIVRNEAERIERCLASVAPWITSYVIVDTGSTDGTPKKIKQFFDERKIPGLIKNRPFIHFAQARNAALELARAYKRKGDYLLLCDADMELVVTDPKAFAKLKAPSYDMMQHAGSLVYANRRLVRTDQTGVYLGVTHEYLDVGGEDMITGAHFIDHADGSNRKDKFKRDIALLEEALKTEPLNGRYWFYLAQSYRDAGQHMDALKAYTKRVEIGGWDEEVWNAKLNVAHCWKALGNDAMFTQNCLEAFSLRPQRAESLYDLANHFRVKGQNGAGAVLAQAAMQIKQPDDLLFVSSYAHHTGPREEFAICGYYVPHLRQRAFEVCSHLAVDKAGTPQSREQARMNLFFYLKPLGQLMPVTHTRIPFAPPDGYIAMNPSIVLHDNTLKAIVRTVNYNITESGHYIIRGTDGSANDRNPIDTRNFLLTMDRGFAPTSAEEIQRPDYVPLFPLVRGFEDSRLFVHDQELASSSCMRDLNSEGWCEQVFAPIKTNSVGLLSYGKPVRMLPKDRQHEKNWAPFSIYEKLEPRWLYRLGSVVDITGKITHSPRNHLDTGHISGSSQVIPFRGNYLTIVHEARVRPDNGVRYYHHRFALLDYDGGLLRLSLPFVFQANQIEFCAGLCWHPDHQRLVMSYGVRDCEAWCSTVLADDVDFFMEDH